MVASPVPRLQEGGRRNWFLEQISTPPIPTFPDKNRSQASFNFTHFGDSISIQESALLNLHVVELGAKFSQRMYPRLFDESTALKNSSNQERNTATFEIARNFITATNHYGRLGLEYIHIFPHKTRYLHIGIHMGMMESTENPYSMRINIDRFQRVSIGLLGMDYEEYNEEGEHDEGGTWVLSSEIARAYKNEEFSKWRVGGFLKWTYRQRDLFETIVNKYRLYEHMLFTFGPFTEWFNGNTNIRIAANFRLLIDKSIETVGDPAVVRGAAYPMDLRLPDLNFQFTYIF